MNIMNLMIDIMKITYVMLNLNMMMIMMTIADSVYMLRCPLVVCRLSVSPSVTRTKRAVDFCFKGIWFFLDLYIFCVFGSVFVNQLLSDLQKERYLGVLRPKPLWRQTCRAAFMGAGLSCSNSSATLCEGYVTTGLPKLTSFITFLGNFQKIRSNFIQRSFELSKSRY